MNYVNKLNEIEKSLIIDDVEINELAKNYADFMTDGHINCEEEHWNLQLGFNAGYRKALKTLEI